MRNGRLHQLHRGVYLVGHTVPPPHAPEMAALLACGPHAVLSHRSAAVLWDLLPHQPSAHIAVTVPPRRGAERPLIAIHRFILERRDIRRRYGLTLTSPPRTILDLAGELASEELERVVAEANYRRLATELELRHQLDRNRGRRGNERLRRILGLPGGPSRTRSPAELRMVHLLRGAGIAGFVTNARIHGYEVDFLWRELDFAVEIDGYRAHSGRLAFERDRLRLATLKAKGLDLMPVTPRQLHEDPDGVLERLVAALAAAGDRDGVATGRRPAERPRGSSRP